MEGKMKAVVMTGVRKLVWEERDIPVPEKGELLIKLEYVGVCGSDLHFYSEGRLANWIPKEPLVLGHEPAGIVAEIGAGVENFQIGDKVTLEPGVPCGECEECRNGLYNLCKKMKFMAIPGERDGVFSEYCTHAASMTYKLPDTVGTLEGCLIEPLAVGMHACELSNAKIGESAVVLGCGCIGLVTIMSLRARGIREIYAVDVMDKRLAKAKEVGAVKTINSKKENVEKFIKSLPDSGVNQVYECAGNRGTTSLSAKLIRRGGKVTLVGVSPEPILEMDLANLNANEGTVYSVFRYRNMYPRSINAVSEGLIPLKKIVSHEFDFKDIVKGMEDSLNHKDEVIKAVIKF